MVFQAFVVMVLNICCDPRGDFISSNWTILDADVRGSKYSHEMLSFESLLSEYLLLRAFVDTYLYILRRPLGDILELLVVRPTDLKGSNFHVVCIASLVLLWRFCYWIGNHVRLDDALPSMRIRCTGGGLVAMT